ncbi:hypothetical protein ACWD4B_34175 [Streptomyces sp. NPDC002536]
MTEHPNSHGSAHEPSHAPAHGHGEDAAPGRTAAGAYGTSPRAHRDPDPAAPGAERCRTAAAGADAASRARPAPPDASVPAEPGGHAGRRGPGCSG